MAPLTLLVFNLYKQPLLPISSYSFTSFCYPYMTSYFGFFKGTSSHFMASNAEENGAQKKYKGIRRRKWGKWVSEIRVPGSQNRLWLGSYATPEAAAVARDVAFYCLHRPPSLDGLNFPLMLPARVHAEMSPKSVQRTASDAGMAVDAQMILNKSTNNEIEVNENGVTQAFDQTQFWDNDEHFGQQEEKELSISVEDYLT